MKILINWDTIRTIPFFILPNTCIPAIEIKKGIEQLFESAMHLSACCFVQSPLEYIIPTACAPFGIPPNIPIRNAPERFLEIPKIGAVMNDMRLPALCAIPDLDSN